MSEKKRLPAQTPAREQPKKKQSTRIDTSVEFINVFALRGWCAR